MEKLRFIDHKTLINDLNLIPLDTEEYIFCLYQEEFLFILNSFLQGQLDSSELENIADLLESKDGVSSENEYIKESIHKIANIGIQGVTMIDLVRGIIKECK